MTTDLLAGTLGDQGWNAAPGGGWTDPAGDITVRQTAPASYVVIHAGSEHILTSATGALCLVDMLLRRKTAAAAE